MVRQLIGRGAAVLAVAPAVALGVWSVQLAVESTYGGNPNWALVPVNMTEATAVRDQATVASLIAKGEDPHQRRELRPDLVFNERAMMTPFEAAVAVDRTEIAELLLWTGYQFAPGEWRQLRCLSQMEKHGDMDALLDAHRPDDTALDCTGVTRPWTR